MKQKNIRRAAYRAVRELFCGRETLDYVSAGQTFRGYFLLLLPLVQIPKIVGACGIGGDDFLLRLLLQWFLLQF
jgi:hypothetical protein